MFAYKCEIEKVVSDYRTIESSRLTTIVAFLTSGLNTKSDKR